MQDQSTGVQMTVLIADDSQVVAKRLMTMLAELRGIEIAGHAGTVPEALHAVRSLRPNVVILDLQMPGGRGMDVLKTIKREQPSSMVIVLTNHGYPQYSKKCMENGARFFFDKSTEFQKVTAVLSELVNGASYETPRAER
jgi:DNA-binding NarL/FixJ family response regulator